ncbi:MAG: hypothetical protein JNK11_10735 [Alphaproteobacteria bacterium]|nr:hypothetical protein [Alphaproteobacteria bacterium]
MAANVSAEGAGPGRRRGARAAALLGLALLAACQTQPGAPPGYEQRLAAAQGALAACGRAHGYDPWRAALDAPPGLAAGERDWRGCAYAALEQHLVPGSAVPDQYRALVAEDRTLTDRIEAGEATRAARQSRISELFALIDANERLGDMRAGQRQAEIALKVLDRRQAETAQRARIDAHAFAAIDAARRLAQQF